MPLKSDPQARLPRALAALDSAARGVIVATMSAMVAVVSVQVLLRYAFNASLDWGEDVARLLFIWTIFLAIPLGIRQGAHIAIELLVKKLPPVAEKQLARLMGVLSTVLMSVVCYEASLLVVEQWDENMPTLGVSTALFMVPVALGAAHSIAHLALIVVRGAPVQLAVSAE